MPPPANRLLGNPKASHSRLRVTAPILSNEVVNVSHPPSIARDTFYVKHKILNGRDNCQMPLTTFASRFRLARKSRDLTLEQVADRAGCSKQTLNHIERGRVLEVKMGLLYALSDVLQTSPRWLATGKGTQRQLGEISDHERDMIYIYRRLPKHLQEHFSTVLESLSTASAEAPSPIAPFGARSTARKT